jgi:O-antigen/teichoic acid export membrane protein
VKSKILSILFRFGGISGKFLLVFLLTKNISLEFQGEYTLINSNVALLIIFLGLDFYIFSNRLIVKKPEKLIFILKNSLMFYIGMYIMFIPILIIMVYFELVTSDIALLFFFLVITEHLSQELFRIYIAIENVIVANVLFFLRTGAWSWPISIFLLLNEGSSITLFNILVFWFSFSLASVVIGVFYIPNIRGFGHERIDKKWVIKGLKVGLMMFVSTIFLKIIEYSDRYFINYYLGKKELGIYAFYYQFSNIINVLIFTLYISYAYPKILKSVYDKNLLELKKEKRGLLKNTLIIVAFFLIFTFTLLPFILEIINKTELTSNIELIYILIFAALFFNLSFASHFVLVAEEKEKLIIKASIIACLCNVILNVIMIPKIGIFGSAIALLISSFILFAIKTSYDKNLINKWNK